MNLQLNKKKIKSLSKDTTLVPAKLTPNVVGGGVGASAAITCNPMYCNVGSYAKACDQV
ncbi:hypothetical protein ACFOEE_00335 [Pseudoalteromonas fenneropenaei]|uniref:Bacteriocin n=1 Tax=Pseudoalteromonas fenneropenaei TaxID=1737459 RepID=A0ABV7CEJ5_9GAMM